MDKESKGCGDSLVAVWAVGDGRIVVRERENLGRN